MKRTKSFSLYAFIIAFSVHFIAILLLIILNLFVPHPSQKSELPKEERFRLSLKENPKAAKEAAVKNTLHEAIKERPIPRGEQLTQPSAATTPPKAVPLPPRPQPLLPQPTLPQPAPEPVAEKPQPAAEPKKAFLPHVAKTVATIEKTPVKKEPGLYDILSKADPSGQNVMSKPSSTRVSDSIQRLYGDKFSELSAGEQKYIIDNQEVMRRITQGVLDRYGRSKIPDSIRINDTNMIEFYLHPDGSISDLHFIKNSQLSLLDDTTKETIELAYARYPRPEQKTLIRYRVWYNLTGY